MCKYIIINNQCIAIKIMFDKLHAWIRYWYMYLFHLLYKRTDFYFKNSVVTKIICTIFAFLLCWCKIPVIMFLTVSDTWVPFIFFCRMKSKCSPLGWIPRWCSSSTPPRVERATGRCGSEPKSGTNTPTMCGLWL